MVDGWQVQELRDREQAAQNHISDLRGMLATCRGDIARMEQLIEERDEEIERMRNQLSLCHAQIDGLLDDVAPLRQQLAEARAEVKT